MLNKKINQIANKKFQNVYIVDNRNSWINCLPSFNSKTDIVFCLDFGLKNDLEKSGACVYFLDHIVEPSLLQDANYQMHNFLDNWFKDVSGQSLLVYKGLKLGDALLLNLITETTSFCHFFFNAIAIRRLSYETLILAVEDDLVQNVFEKLNFSYINVHSEGNNSKFPEYVFPISFWVNSKLYKKTLKQRISGFFKNILSFIHFIIDFVNKPKPNFYIQDYHPTQKIISNLIKLKILVRTPEYSLLRPILTQRRIPKYYLKKRNSEEANLLKTFISANKFVWHYEGYNLSAFLYEIITPILIAKLSVACNTANSIIRHFRKNNYSLVVPVTNYWLENRLIMNCARNKNIPIFMIANGLLNMSFEKDGRDSDYINCYSKVVKEDYFKNSNNAFCLGDPRMDNYFSLKKKQINRENPVIIIGAAGFNSIDLNSYLAYEFDFLYDILQVLTKIRLKGLRNKIIIKIRDNGYAYQYKNFIKEYFNDLNIDVIQYTPFSTLILQADLYISIYSQTLFEASCLSIPVIYYKKDTQFINRPFDGLCELVTAKDVTELQEKINLFYSCSNVYNEFMEKSVLEKYIGPLDGKNTERNIDFIMDLVAGNFNSMKW